MTNKSIRGKICFINQDSGYLMVDILNSFCSMGYECSLVAGRIVERETKLNPGVRVKKVIRYNRGSNLKRLLSWFIASIQIFSYIVFCARDSHLFIVSNPPFATLLPFFRRNYSLMIFDLYPDALVEFGIIGKDSFVNRRWASANTKVYNKADRIYTLTRGMSKALERYVLPGKITQVPLWTNNNFLKPIPKAENRFIKDHHLEGKFLVVYSGNFGRAHYFDLIIEIASRINDESIEFVIISGSPEDSKEREKKYGMKNCLFLPLQQVMALPMSLASADLAVVTLSENAASLGIPSKFFNFLSVGAPVLCISGKESELSEMVTEYNVGRAFTPPEIDDIVQFITNLSIDRHLCEFYRKNSLAASKFHTEKNIGFITKYYV